MKKFLVLVFICFAQNIFSQTIKKDDVLIIDEPTNKTIPNEDNDIYNIAGIDIRPEFPGGNIVFDNFFEKNFKIPKDKPELKGKIYVTFIVEKDGSLNDIKVLRDIGYETGTEAIRVLKISPKWIPGKRNNRLVRVLYSMPISLNNFTN